MFRIRAFAVLLPLLAGCTPADEPARVEPGTRPYFQRLTTTNEVETAPAFSPDGTRVAYERTGAIWVLDVATRAAAKAAPFGYHPSWTADGSGLVFVRRDIADSGAGLIHRLVRLTLASGVVDTLSSDSVDAYEPAAAPIGSSIALRNLSRVNRDQTLRVVRGDGADVATLTEPGTWTDTSPAWSRDGAWIAFVRLESSGLPHLMRVPASGSASATAIASATSGAADPAWHPDGRLFFAKNGVISWTAPNGGAVTPFVEGAGYELAPTLSPDGRRLVFTTDRTGNGELWMLVDPNGLGPGPYAY